MDEIKKENESTADLNKLKIQYNITETNQYEILNKELVPLSLIDYETQCKIKKRRLELFLNQFVKKISTYSSTIILDRNGNPCVFNDLIRSEPVDEYQSQNQFQISIDVNKRIAVGFMIGNFKEGQTCIRPTYFLACKKSHRLLAEKFETYLNEKSQLRVILDFKSREGNWTNFFIRSNQEGEHQCLAIMNNQNLTTELLDKERNLLIDYFKPISDEFKIRSLNLEITSSMKKDLNEINLDKNQSTVHPNLELLFGDRYLPFKLNNQLYNVSVKSSFPANINAYLKMINMLIENLDLTKNENLIFVNPFSGLALPDLAKQVDVLNVINKEESQINCYKESLKSFKSLKNIKFSSGNLMKAIFKILDNNFKQICVIIRQEDLSIQILNELRNNKNVNKIVLISTKPQENLLKIWIQLCLDNKNNTITGNPFNFISATPIDTHPHSNIYTIVSIFERLVN